MAVQGYNRLPDRQPPCQGSSVLNPKLCEAKTLQERINERAKSMKTIRANSTKPRNIWCTRSATTGLLAGLLCGLMPANLPAQLFFGNVVGGGGVGGGIGI